MHLISLLLAFCSSSDSTEVDCDDHLKNAMGKNGFLSLNLNHPEIADAYMLRNKSTYMCFDFLIRLMNLSNLSNESQENKQEKRQLAVKSNRRKPTKI